MFQLGNQRRNRPVLSTVDVIHSKRGADTHPKHKRNTNQRHIFRGWVLRETSRVHLGSAIGLGKEQGIREYMDMCWPNLSPMRIERRSYLE